jgi:hypothetical protein
LDVKTALQKLSGGQKKSRKPKGLPKRVGRRSAKYIRYYAQIHDKRKLRRIIRHNGHAAAKAWADARAILSLYTIVAKDLAN